jgi:hypothetical protein
LKIQYEAGLQKYCPNNDGATYTQLELGVYTVVAGDELGTLVEGHFTVSQ